MGKHARNPSAEFMPLWFDRFDSAALGMTGEEKGLFLLLIITQWFGGPLPHNPNEIALVVAYDRKTFTRLWKRVSKKFNSSKDGLINEEFQKAKFQSEARSSKARKAARARWDKSCSEQCSNDARSHASALCSEQCSNDALLRLRSKRLTKAETGHE